MLTVKGPSFVIVKNPRQVNAAEKQSMSVEDRMIDYIQSLFVEVIKLHPRQPIRIEALGEHLPFIRLMAEEAYKTYGAGRVSVKLIEPEVEVEALKKKYNITADFDYKNKDIEELTKQNAIFIAFDETCSPYAEAGLTTEETQRLVRSIVPEIPASIQNKLTIDPKEILQGNLSLRKGQPLVIVGSREHMPQILKLAEYSYQSGSTLVDIRILESKENDLAIPFYKHASDAVLEEVPLSEVARLQEYLDKNVARLSLEGSNPAQLEGINPEKIAKSNAALGEAIKEIRAQLVFKTPWCIYYLPTTASATAAYPEYGTDRMRALEHAAKDARKINRVGQNEEHIKKLIEIAHKITALVKQGYRTIRYVSVDLATKTPDGKTNLKIGLSGKAIFKAAHEKTPTGQEFIPNTPTEEVFTSPDNTKADGIVSATMPLCLNGMLVESIKMEFKDGRIARDEQSKLKVSATSNEQMLIEHIERHKGADRLGEASFVAESPIFDLGRVHKKTLIDENATCHIAIGSGFPFCIEDAISIEDRQKQKEYLEHYNLNSSTTHNDFMIGGPNVQVYLEKDDGSQFPIIIDNRFCI